MNTQQMELSNIGAIIRQARLDKGMTEEELAAKSGTTKTMINKIETKAGSVKISAIRNIIENGLGGRMELAVQV
ncbi:MAG TPA: helix-turn-helix transcriptional regulator [Mucilaginibacter sp.]|jgi:transcriptional regulator with XRE-family HTH domain